MNRDPTNSSKQKELDKPAKPVKVTVGRMSLLYRKLFDITDKKLCAFINRQRPVIDWVSQCGQDSFVAEKIFNRKRQGFFLEIGGGDGQYLSNTFILEAFFEWRGILVEPTGAFEAMVKNRPKAICAHAAISGSRKTVRLFEILDKGQAAMNPAEAGSNTLLSVIEDVDTDEPAFRPMPQWAEVQKSYLINTITLDDLLVKYDAPKVIDYFSLDVEGAEYQILKDFPFEKWRFNCIGVETPPPELQQLLLANRYTLVKVGQLDWFYLHLDYLAQWFDERILGAK